MEMISEDLVEETWREVAEFEDEHAQAEMASLSRIQPYLLAFMVEFTRELDPDVAELALYLFLNVHRTFEKSGKKPLEQVTHETIIEPYESNGTLLTRFEGSE